MDPRENQENLFPKILVSPKRHMTESYEFINDIKIPIDAKE